MSSTSTETMDEITPPGAPHSNPSKKEGNISLSSVIQAKKELLDCEIKGEAVILNITSGVYFGLDSVGARVWELIKTPRSVDDVLSTLTGEYMVDYDQCKSDLFLFINNLIGAELIEVK
jgi:hypothetical protein